MKQMECEELTAKVEALPFENMTLRNEHSHALQIYRSRSCKLTVIRIMTAQTSLLNITVNNFHCHFHCKLKILASKVTIQIHHIYVIYQGFSERNSSLKSTAISRKFMCNYGKEWTK